MRSSSSPAAEKPRKTSPAPTDSSWWHEPISSCDASPRRHPFLNARTGKPYEHDVRRHLIAPTRTRGYVLRAFPTIGQAQRINQLIGQGRYLYNWMLSVQNNAFAQGMSLHDKPGKALLNALITAKMALAKRGADRVLTHPGDPSMWGEHWLVGCPRTLITQKVKDLTESWDRFFQKTGGKPKFQRRSSSDSFRFQIDPRQYDREIAVHDIPAGTPAQDIWVKIPNVGRVRVELHEPIHGCVVLVTVRKRPARKFSAKHLTDPNVEPARYAGYELVLTVKDVPVERDRPKNWAQRVDWERDALVNGGPGLLGTGLGEKDPSGVIALDMSVPLRAITSNGDELGRRDRDAATVRNFERYQKRTKRIQRKISRKARCRQREAGLARAPSESSAVGTTGKAASCRNESSTTSPLPPRNTWTAVQKQAMRPSARQQVLMDRLARELGRARRQRRHDADVFTTFLVLYYHTIVVEGLTLKGMAQSLSKGFRRGFSEAAMGEILAMLAYKCQLYGRTLVVINKWFPSSKRCCCCHLVNKNLTLSDRVWTCSGCKAVHQRDPNAAINLKQEGCAAVGISFTGADQALLHSGTAGESPVAGRRGLHAWIGEPKSSGISAPHAAGEASRCRGNPISKISTNDQTTRCGLSIRVG